MGPTDNSFQQEDFGLYSAEDCHYLLRALEKQAFEHVLFALRAQGPLTRYKELLLSHLRAALFIDDDEFNLKIRLAANNHYLTRISHELNPSYDNFTDWMAAGYDLAGVELAKIRKMATHRINSKLSNQTNRIFHKMHQFNRTLPNESEAISFLLQLPKQPYVPERLRKLLRDTECDSDERVGICREENIQFSKLEKVKKPAKNNVGRPRKKKRLDSAQQQRKVAITEYESAPRLLSLAKLVKESCEKQTNLSNPNAECVQLLEEAPSTASMENLADIALSQEFLPLTTSMQTADKSPQQPTSSMEASTSSKEQNCVKAEHRCELEPVETTCTVSNRGDNSEPSKKRSQKEKKLRAETDSSSVCARVRPFVRPFVEQNIPTTANREKRPFGSKRKGKAGTNDFQTNKAYYPCFNPNSKYYGQTSIKMLKHASYGATTGTLNNCDNAHQPTICEEMVAEKSNNCSFESQKFGRGFSSNASSVSTLSSLQIATSRFTPQQQSINQNLAPNIDVMDNTYEKGAVMYTVPNNTVVHVNTVENDVRIESDSPISVVNNATSSVHQQMQHEYVGDGLNNGNYATCLTSILITEKLPNTSISIADILVDDVPSIPSTSKNAGAVDLVEPSGLDFLASTASLLTPIETCKNYDNTNNDP